MKEEGIEAIAYILENGRLGFDYEKGVAVLQVSSRWRVSEMWKSTALIPLCMSQCVRLESFSVSS